MRKLVKASNIEVTSPPDRLGDSALASNSIHQLIAEQGVGPIVDLSVLAGAIPDDEVDETVAEMYRGRQAAEKPVSGRR